MAGARKLAREAELEIRQGKDPAQAKVAAQRKTATVEELCRDFIAIYARTIPGSGHGMRWRASSDLNSDPANGGLRSARRSPIQWKDRSVQDITSEDVIDLIDAIAARGARIAANRALTASAIHVWLGSEPKAPEGVAMRRAEAAIEGEQKAAGPKAA